MALEFGFGRWDDEHREFWSERWERIKDKDDDDARLYHHVLPWALMGVGVDHIGALTIPHIVARLEKFYADMYLTLCRVAKATAAEELENDEIDRLYGTKVVEWYLQRFIGFHVNANTETSSEFITRMTQSIPKLTKTTAVKERFIAERVRNEAICYDEQARREQKVS